MLAKIDRAMPPLDSWGSVTNLGFEVIEGDVQAMDMVHGAPTDPVSCAYFGVTRGKFRMTYPFDEHAVVVEGTVTLTDEATGTKTSYGLGDARFVRKGTSVLWDVTSDRVVSNYFASA